MGVVGQIKSTEYVPTRCGNRATRDGDYWNLLVAFLYETDERQEKGQSDELFLVAACDPLIQVESWPTALQLSSSQPSTQNIARNHHLQSRSSSHRLSFFQLLLLYSHRLFWCSSKSLRNAALSVSDTRQFLPLLATQLSTISLLRQLSRNPNNTTNKPFTWLHRSS
jgi:hypothetical protein